MQSVGNMDRTKYIGGSDVAGILGISPWRTALDVYLDKVQPRKEPPSPGKQRFLLAGNGWSRTLLICSLKKQAW